MNLSPKRLRKRASELASRGFCQACAWIQSIRFKGLQNDSPRSLRLQLMQMDGSGNSIVVGKNVRGRLKVHFGGNHNRIVIGPGARFDIVVSMECDDSVLEIGAKTTAESSIFHFAENGTSIRVGEDCMFARETFFLASDFHSILDQTTGVRLNGAHGIDLENHVWVGLGAKVLKNVRIGTGAVIATSSVVTRDVAPHTIVMGIPAKEIKNGIKWVREPLARPKSRLGGG